MTRFLWLACFLVYFVTPLAAQNAPEQRRVVLSDGTVLIGTIVDENADPLVILAENGVEQRIARALISEITPLYNDRYTRPDPNRTRLFLAETGRTLERRTGRFSSYAMVANVAYGLTNRIDISGGAAVPLPTSLGVLTVVNAQVKVQLLPIGDHSGVAVGTNAVLPIGNYSESDETSIIGTYYAVGTLGSASTAATVGVYGFYGSELEGNLGKEVAILLGLEHRVSSSLKLMTENYIVPTSSGTGDIIAVGVRFFGDRLAADVAAFAVANGDEIVFSPIPYFGFSYNFGK